MALNYGTQLWHSITALNYGTQITALKLGHLNYGTQLRHLITALNYYTQLRHSITALNYKTQLRHSMTTLNYGTKLRYSITELNYDTKLRSSITALNYNTKLWHSPCFWKNPPQTTTCVTEDAKHSTSFYCTYPFNSSWETKHLGCGVLGIGCHTGGSLQRVLPETGCPIM